MVFNIGWRGVLALTILFATVVVRGLAKVARGLADATIASSSLGVIFSFLSSPTLTGSLIFIELIIFVYLGLWVAPQLTDVTESLSLLPIVSTATVAIGYVLTVQSTKLTSEPIETLAILCFVVGLITGAMYAALSTEHTSGVRVLAVIIFIIYGQILGYVLTVFLRYSPLLEIIILVSVLPVIIKKEEIRKKSLSNFSTGELQGWEQH